jgi:hypothetical protein
MIVFTINRTDVTKWPTGFSIVNLHSIPIYREIESFSFVFYSTISIGVFIEVDDAGRGCVIAR